MVARTFLGLCVLVAALGSSLAPTSAAGAACLLQRRAAIAATVSADGQLLIQAEIDGKPARLRLDTGLAASALYADGLRRLGLRRSDGWAEAPEGGVFPGDALPHARIERLKLGELTLGPLELPVVARGGSDGGAAGTPSTGCWAPPFSAAAMSKSICATA